MEAVTKKLLKNELSQEVVSLMLERANISEKDLYIDAIKRWVSKNLDLLTPAEREKFASRSISSCVATLRAFASFRDIKSIILCITSKFTYEGKRIITSLLTCSIIIKVFFSAKDNLPHRELRRSSTPYGVEREGDGFSHPELPPFGGCKGLSMYNSFGIEVLSQTSTLYYRELSIFFIAGVKRILLNPLLCSPLYRILSPVQR